MAESLELQKYGSGSNKVQTIHNSDSEGADSDETIIISQELKNVQLKTDSTDILRREITTKVGFYGNFRHKHAELHVYDANDQNHAELIKQLELENENTYAWKLAYDASKNNKISIKDGQKSDSAILFNPFIVESACQKT